MHLGWRSIVAGHAEESGRRGWGGGGERRAVERRTEGLEGVGRRMKPSPTGTGEVSKKRTTTSAARDALLSGLDPFFNCIQTKVRNSERVPSPPRGVAARNEKKRERERETPTVSRSSDEMTHARRRQAANFRTCLRRCSEPSW